jgi:hypothetical protein
LWEQNNKLWEQDIILREQDNMLWEQNNILSDGENSLTLDLMGNTFKDLLRRNYWVNWNQTWSQYSLDDPLSKLHPAGLGPNQHDRQGEPKLTFYSLEKHIG